MKNSKVVHEAITALKSDHVPFDISCNRLRSTLRWLESHERQDKLTPTEKNLIWSAVSAFDKTVTRIMDKPNDLASEHPRSGPTV